MKRFSSLNAFPSSPSSIQDICPSMCFPSHTNDEYSQDTSYTDTLIVMLSWMNWKATCDKLCWYSQIINKHSHGKGLENIRLKMQVHERFKLCTF